MTKVLSHKADEAIRTDLERLIARVGKEKIWTFAAVWTD